MKPSFIPPSSIVVKDRQRTTAILDDAFLTSIRERGIIQPIVIDSELCLVAGGRRLAAAIQLGMATVPVIQRDSPNQEDAELAELEENIRRADLPWQDRCKAIARIHALHVLSRKDDQWTQVMTGELIGESVGSVNYMLQLAKELRDNPLGLPARAENYRSAIQAMVAQREAEADAEWKRRTATRPADQRQQPQLATSSAMPAVATPAKPGEVTVRLSDQVFPIDFDNLNPEEWPPNYFSVVITNDMQEARVRQLKRTLKPCGVVFVLCITEAARTVSDMLEDGGIEPYGTPLIWNRVGEDTDPTFPFNPNYCCFVYASKQEIIPIQRSPSSVISVPPIAGDELPFGVLEFLLKPTSLINGSVNLVGFGPETAVNVAKLGRRPCCFEPDQTKATAIVEALREHYTESIPGVVFV